MRTLSSIPGLGARRRSGGRARSVRFLAAFAAAAAACLIATSAAGAASPPFTQCPALGFDTGCAVLFTVNPDGSVTKDIDPSQPAYDGVEDSLIGVHNNTAVTTIPSLTLTGAGIFGFDG